MIWKSAYISFSRKHVIHFLSLPLELTFLHNQTTYFITSLLENNNNNKTTYIDDLEWTAVTFDLEPEEVLDL